MTRPPQRVQPATLAYLQSLQAQFAQAERALNAALAAVAHEHGIDPNLLVIDMSSGAISRRKDPPHATENHLH